MRAKSEISAFIVLVTTIVSSLAIASGYDNLVRHDVSASVNLAPFASAGTRDGGLWLLAPGTIDKHQLVRLDANGNRTASVFLPTAIIHRLLTDARPRRRQHTLVSTAFKCAHRSKCNRAWAKRRSRLAASCRCRAFAAADLLDHGRSDIGE